MDSRLRRLKTVAQTMSNERFTLSLAKRLESEGIDYVILKGAVFAHWLYDTPIERRYSDADVLVGPHDFDRAESLLQELGFELHWTVEFPGKKARPERDWIRPSDDARVDLHRTIQGTELPPAEVWDILLKHRTKVVIGGTSINALDETANALHAVLHVGQHGKRVGKPLGDLDRVMARVPEEIWPKVLELARELDAMEWLSSGLRLHDEGSRIAERLHLSHASSPEALLRSNSAPPVADAVLWFAQLGTWRERVAFVFRGLFPAPEAMKTVTPLARRGTWGLLVAYPWRWWWLARRLPAAVAAWKRSRVAGDK